MAQNNNQTLITFWGVRGSTPCANNDNMEYGGNTTCIQIQIPDSDEILIFDSGTGIRNLGNKLSEEPGNIRGRIFITHPHWDHIQGFPFFKPIYNSENHFEFHMPVQKDGGCKEILSGHLTETFFPVTLDMIGANLGYITQPQWEVSYEGYSVEFMLASHPINTAIYKIRTGNKEIVFCPDNELNPRSEKSGSPFYTKLKHFFKGVDILIHDAQYDLKSFENKRGWGHSAWEEVVDFAQRSDVKHLFLTHHDPDSSDNKLDELDNQIKTKFCDQFESIQLVKEGTTIAL